MHCHDYIIIKSNWASRGMHDVFKINNEEMLQSSLPKLSRPPVMGHKYDDNHCRSYKIQVK